jgi:putative ABC transport system substrate-binding protein
VNSRIESLAVAQIRDADRAAPQLGLRVHAVDAGSEADIDRAFATIERLQLGALVVSTDPFFASLARRHQIVALSAKHSLPTMYGGRSGPAVGGLMSYGTRPSDTWQQAGRYVARILKGDKPGDLPVVQGTLFETVVNLKTAKALGLVIPTKVLAAADEIIE